MASHSITITNRVGVYGPSDANQWSEYNWGAFEWAVNQDLKVSINKVVANSTAMSSSIDQDVTKALANTLSLDSAIRAFFVKVIGNSLSLDGDMGGEILMNGDWTYNWPDRATDAEGRDTADWTGDAEESTTWTEDDEETTNWS